MERSVLAVAFAVFLMAVFLAPAFSLPTSHVDDMEGKIMDTEKRPKYMDTRDEVKNLIYGTVVELVAEGKLSPAILPSQEDSALEKPKEKRYMRICFTKMANHFVPYPCNGRK